MDKQKQIEEMAVICCGSKTNCTKCFEEYKNVMGVKIKKRADHCQAYNYAERLYNAGYRKIPEGAVVLTIPFGQELHFLYSREHYEKPQPPCIYSTKDWIFNVRSDGETWFTVAGRGICFYGEYLYQLGKTVFLSKEEAEKKLQEKLKCQ